MNATTRREIAVAFGALITIGFFFLVPMVTPGFPRPVVSDVRFYSEPDTGGFQYFYLTGIVKNEGTQGNVIITVKLVNASRGEVMARTSDNVFMLPGDSLTYSKVLTGRTAEPYDIVFEARRR